MDFFQEDTPEALRSQAGWIIETLGMPKWWLSRVVGMEEQEMAEWLEGDRPIQGDAKERMDALWYLVLHLLSFQNSDAERVRQMFHVGSELRSPWRTASIGEYLEKSGLEGIVEVDKWVTAFRFKDLYVAEH